MRDTFLFLAFLSLALRSVVSICPQPCTCDIDEFGRKRTRCETGGLAIPGNVDLTQLDADVEVLIISGSKQNPNRFTVFDSTMFQNKRFKEIHISFSNLETIGEKTFFPVANTLQVLNLTWNSLKVVSEGNFKNLSRLTHLHLDHNQIYTIYSAVFNFLGNLKVLTISDNAIADVPPRMALQLNKLEVLDLSSNPLGKPDSFGKPTDANGIPEAFFGDLTSLRKLNLANTSTKSLPWDAIQRSILDLEDLDLSDNVIDEVRANQLSKIRKLTKIKLANNPIRSIQPNALSGMRLQSLDLSGLNPNLLIPGIFANALIINLDVSNMGLTALNREAFLPISQELIGLNISGNPELPIEARMFELLPALKDLTMKRMRKTQLPLDFFSYQNQLENLDLSENELLDLDDNFFVHLQNLGRVNLASNQLQRVPVTLNLPRIQEIDLYDNRLTSFPDTLAMSFASPSSALRSLHLNKNPWNCDCGVASLGRWLVRQDGNNGFRTVCQGINNFTCPVCQSPENLKGVSLDRLQPQLLDTCSVVGNPQTASNANVDVIIAVVVCLIVLIIAVLLLVLWYRNRLHSYRTYEEKRKDNEIFDHNGDAEVFAEDAPPISKPKTNVPLSIPPLGAQSVKSQPPKTESDV
jgi:Leucine-rich repeat (LRR) protein